MINIRISYVGTLNVLDKGDVERLVKQRIYPDCDEKCLRAFENACNKNARVLFNTLKRTKDLQISTSDKLNAGMIESARRLLLI